MCQLSCCLSWRYLRLSSCSACFSAAASTASRGQPVSCSRTALQFISVCQQLSALIQRTPPHYYTTHPLNGHLSGTSQLSRYQKGKPVSTLLKQETVSGSGISWAICKSAPRSRQITTPTPDHSVFLQAGCPSCLPTNSVNALKA